MRRLIAQQVTFVAKRNVVSGRTFSEMLAAALNHYRNSTIDAPQVITELAMAIRAQRRRGERTGLTENELPFRGALWPPTSPHARQ